MSASQFVIDNILEVFGGAGLVITALATFLGKMISDKSILREKVRFQADLQRQNEQHQYDLRILEKQLQIDLAKNERFNQISKTTFENIFSNRISVYSDLISLRTEYYSFINEGHEVEVDDEALEGYQILFSRCRNLIEENRLYISSELSKSYDDWLNMAAPYYKEVNISGYEIHQSFHDDDHDGRQHAYMASEAVIFTSMFRATIVEMTKIFDQIAIDVEHIREAIDMKHLTYS